VSVALTVAVAVNTEGQRQVIGMKVGPSEAETFWTEFLRSLIQVSAEAAHTQGREVADQLRGKLPKLGALMDGAEHEVLSRMNFPRAHWLQTHGTNPLERLNAEIKRRTNVVGIFPTDAAPSPGWSAPCCWSRTTSGA
jgi:transposase-like protein